MTPRHRLVLVPSALLAGAVLLTVLAMGLAPLPAALRVLAPAAAAFGAAWLLLDRLAALRCREAIVIAGRVAAAEARTAELTRQAAQLRHDLRGILSPAMLTADRLAASTDPIARRAGEAMIATVERAEERLRPERGG